MCRCLRERLERAAQCLVPRLRCGDAEDLLLAVADVQVEVGEELRLGEGIGGIDAEVCMRPGRTDSRLATHLDSPADPQAVRQAGMQPRGQVEVSVPLELVPERVAEGRSRHGFRPASSVLVITVREAEPRAALRQVIPTVPPWQLDGTPCPIWPVRAGRLATTEPCLAAGPP